MNPKHCNSAFRRGFSLVELVIVMVIIGVLGAIALPRFSQASARQRLDAAADRVAADLNRARDHARASSQAVIVSFDINTHSYTITYPDGEVQTIQLDESPFECQIVGGGFSGSPTVSFHNFGTPDSHGNVVLGAGGRTIKVTVHHGGEITR